MTLPSGATDTIPRNSYKGRKYNGKRLLSVRQYGRYSHAYFLTCQVIGDSNGYRLQNNEG